MKNPDELWNYLTSLQPALAAMILHAGVPEGCMQISRTNDSENIEPWGVDCIIDNIGAQDNPTNELLRAAQDLTGLVLSHNCNTTEITPSDPIPAGYGGIKDCWIVAITGPDEMTCKAMVELVFIAIKYYGEYSPATAEP